MVITENPNYLLSYNIRKYLCFITSMICYLCSGFIDVIDIFQPHGLSTELEATHFCSPLSAQILSKK